MDHKLHCIQQQWMCGGMVLSIPCSRAGFVYAMESPFLSLKMIQNRLLIAESLMDDYKRHFYNVYFLTNESAEAIADNIDARVEATNTLRRKSNCYPFEWYMETVYYDQKEPLAESQYAGLVCHKWAICITYTVIKA